MSYLQQVVQCAAHQFVLPRIGAMRCEVHAFLSPELFAQTDETLWRQAAQAAATPGATGLYLMPDTHPGYHLPVGGVLVTEDVILQSGSGYDINCGVVYLQVPGLHASDVADVARRRRWVQEVSLRVGTGVGSVRPAIGKLPGFRHVREVLRHGAKPLGVSRELCERQSIPVPETLDVAAVDLAYTKALTQLGSVGGGNHFIEMQVDGADGSVWLMIHCGSRGYGWQVADHYFRRGAALRGLPQQRREQSWLRLDEPLGAEYWGMHNAAANFAIANRHTIVQGVNDALEAVWGVRGELWYEISHNLVQEELLVLPDGSTRKGFVHRKGATRAFPAGHPQLRGTRWEHTGHPCLIPGSMRDGAAILYPLQGAYASGCSVNHGSGRRMGRAQAKSELAELQEVIDQDMAQITRMLGGVEIRGIVGNTPKTPLDECGHVYKDLDQVLAVLTESGIARLERRLYPVANIKGTD